ncbi:MAG TPA: lipocalin family protein [Pyrinomonadaceae bacterium]|jgi:apolipoprotein D and lipocalin family protein|nr:lipocalin family protein [Pyrinomonadaceae bacterium]
MKNGNRILIAVAVTLAAATLVKASKKEDTPPLNVVPSVDLKKYAGKWYEIARLPNSFQKNCAGDVTATYTPRPDGKIGVLNECREKNGDTKKAEGLARVASENEPNTKLKVRFAPSFLSFLPFAWGDYWMIELAPDYSHVVVGTPSRKYLWVLARTPRMDESLYKELLDKAAAQGFDTKRVAKTEQRGS